MSALVKRCLPELERIKRQSAKRHKHYFARCDGDIIRCCCEIARNIINECIPLNSRQLKLIRRHGKNVKLLAAKKTGLKKKRKILQTGGFIGALLGPAIGFLSSLLLGNAGS